MITNERTGRCRRVIGYVGCHSTLLHSHASLHPHFAALQNIRFRLFGLAKRQLLRTLNDICPGVIVGNI